MSIFEDSIFSQVDFITSETNDDICVADKLQVIMASIGQVVKPETKSQKFTCECQKCQQEAKNGPPPSQWTGPSSTNLQHGCVHLLPLVVSTYALSTKVSCVPVISSPTWWFQIIYMGVWFMFLMEPLKLSQVHFVHISVPRHREKLLADMMAF